MTQPDELNRRDDPFVVPAGLNRRLGAAAVDAMVFGVCGLGFVSGVGALRAEEMPGWAWKVSLGTIAVAAVVEMLSGWTVGKAMMGLRVRGIDGGRAPLWRLVVRALVRLAPVALCLASAMAGEISTQIVIIAAAAVWAATYFPMCYISIFRIGRTTFDLIAGTVVRDESET